jgi:hypothetical protein
MIRVTKGTAIRSLRPGAEFSIFGDKLTWIDTEQSQPAEAEITAEMERLEALALIPPPDWRGFLAALRDTTVFQGLRGQARADVGANALATELRLALGEAALGMADIDSIQALLEELLPTLDEPQVAEIAAAIEEFHIPLALE